MSGIPGAGPGPRLEPVRLTGGVVRLEPLDDAHLPGLLEAAAHPEIWRWLRLALDTEAALSAYLAEVREAQARGTGLAFAIRHLQSEALVGGSSYLNASPGDRRVEIGFTWITPARQRTAVNTEIKLLMLRHAFEGLACERVEFKTDARNERSRAALRRIGASEEGTLRHHMLLPDGSFRDSTYYSILRGEWPEVARRLEERLRTGG